MKFIIPTFFTLIFLIGIMGFQKPGPVKKEALLTCKMTACESKDSIYLFEFNGVIFKKIAAAGKTVNGGYQIYQFKLPVTGPRFYYVGLGGSNMRPIILGSEKEVTVTGPCSTFRNAQIENSSLNQNYTNLKVQINQLKSQMSGLIRQYQRFQGNVEHTERLVLVTANMKKVDEQYVSLLDSLKKADPYLATVSELNTYLSYQNNQGAYPNEVEYFAKEYFHFADWKKEDYQYNPWVYEGFKTYTATLGSIGLSQVAHQQYLENALAEIPEDSRTYQLAIGGMLSVMKDKSHPNFTHFAKKYIDKYRKTETESAAMVNNWVTQVAAFSIGGQAPDFSMPSPEGEELSLSDFRGKVLLVDFWASWCGPCRRENPHVKALYSKYGDKGFEILAVSLDKQKDRWVQAIEKDGLTWSHVSDLRGWKNAAALTYGVKSIPHTILLDKEGKILARNLRGPTLEAKLKEIFGE